MRRTAAAALVALCVVAVLSGCGADASPQTSAHSSSPTAAQHDVDWYPLTDPLTELRSPSSDEFVARHPQVLLHQKATGQAVFTLSGRAPQVAFFVSCSPDASFTVSVGKSFSGTCAHRFLVIGAIPLPESTQSPTVSVAMPKGVTYWIVGIGQDKEGNYSSLG